MRPTSCRMYFVAWPSVIPIFKTFYLDLDVTVYNMLNIGGKPCRTEAGFNKDVCTESRLDKKSLENLLVTLGNWTPLHLTQSQKITACAAVLSSLDTSPCYFSLISCEDNIKTLALWVKIAENVQSAKSLAKEFEFMSSHIMRRYLE